MEDKLDTVDVQYPIPQAINGLNGLNGEKVGQVKINSVQAKKKLQQISPTVKLQKFAQKRKNITKIAPQTSFLWDRSNQGRI